MPKGLKEPFRVMQQKYQRIVNKVKGFKELSISVYMYSFSKLKIGHFSADSSIYPTTYYITHNIYIKRIQKSHFHSDDS